MQPDWSKPLKQESLLRYFEGFQGRDFQSEDVSSNMVIIGILTGFRLKPIDTGSREVQFCLSQGGNYEIRFSYLGMLLYILTLAF